MKNLVYIVAARIGSSRVYKKPLQKFDNSTLVEWKINQLLKIKDAKIILSSDSNEILDLFKDEMRVEKHKRNHEFASDHNSSFPLVIDHLVDVAMSRYGKDINIAFTYPVTPLMSTADYVHANLFYEENVINGSFDSLVAVNQSKEYLWSDDGPINYSADKNHVQSQMLPNVYKVTNSLYMAPAKVMKENTYFLGKNPILYYCDKLCAVDIDTQEDLEIARNLIPLYKKTNLLK